MLNENRVEIKKQIESAFDDDKFIILTGQSGVGKTNLAIKLLGNNAISTKRWELTPNDFIVSTNKKLIIDEGQRLDKDSPDWTSFIINALKHQMKIIVIAQHFKDLPFNLYRDIDGKLINIETPIY